MTNDDAILKAIESLRKDMATKSDLQSVNKRLDSLTADVKTVDMKVEAFNNKLDSTAKEVKEEVKETIERETKAISELFNDTFEKQEELEKRIERVEKRLDLPQL